MVKTNKDITTQNHLKLSILQLQNGLSFCIKNTINQEIEHQGFININEPFIFHDTIESFDIINLAIVNNLNTFVPKSFFSEDAVETYLKFNNKILKTDQFSFNEIQNFDLINVFIKQETVDGIEINEKSHFATTLVSKLLEQNKNVVQLQFFVHFIENSFQIIIIENSNLVFYNSFIYTSEIDVLYYILFVAEQFRLNPEEFSLLFLGDISIDTPIYDIVYQYVRNISFYQPKNYTNHHHFVLNHL